jgi:hypothetical protein
MGSDTLLPTFIQLLEAFFDTFVSALVIFAVTSQRSRIIVLSGHF